jgi:hypothetical protein
MYRASATLFMNCQWLITELLDEFECLVAVIAPIFVDWHFVCSREVKLLSGNGLIAVP